MNRRNILAGLAALAMQPWNPLAIRKALSVKDEDAADVVLPYISTKEATEAMHVWQVYVSLDGTPTVYIDGESAPAHSPNPEKGLIAFTWNSDGNLKATEQ